QNAKIARHCFSTKLAHLITFLVGRSFMHSLFDALLAQHVRQLAPVRCAHSTIAQLHSYFEEVVLENNLNALVIESLPLVSNRSARETARVRQLARSGRRTFFFLNPSDSLNESLDSISHNTGFNPVL